jgi:hypothetical protein
MTEPQALPVKLVILDSKDLLVLPAKQVIKEAQVLQDKQEILAQQAHKVSTEMMAQQAQLDKQVIKEALALRDRLALRVPLDQQDQKVTQA